MRLNGVLKIPLLMFYCAGSIIQGGPFTLNYSNNLGTVLQRILCHVIYFFDYSII